MDDRGLFWAGKRDFCHPVPSCWKIFKSVTPKITPNFIFKFLTPKSYQISDFKSEFKICHQISDFKSVTQDFLKISDFKFFKFKFKFD